MAVNQQLYNKIIGDFNAVNKTKNIALETGTSKTKNKRIISEYRNLNLWSSKIRQLLKKKS